MSKTSILLCSSLLLLTSCQENPKPAFTPPRQHIQTSQELDLIMHKFDNLIFQHFQSELERDEQRLVYTKEIATLLDELIANTKELQSYSNQHSLEYIQFSNALEVEAQKLKQNIATYQTEEIEPTLHNITQICNQCHATLH